MFRLSSIVSHKRRTHCRRLVDAPFLSIRPPNAAVCPGGTSLGCTQESRKVPERAVASSSDISRARPAFHLRSQTRVQQARGHDGSRRTQDMCWIQTVTLRSAVPICNSSTKFIGFDAVAFWGKYVCRGVYTCSWVRCDKLGRIREDDLTVTLITTLTASIRLSGSRCTYLLLMSLPLTFAGVL